MPGQLPVTVIVPTKNEAANIERCLGSLSRAKRVYVVDSQSTDGTAEIAAGLGAEVVQFQYRGGYPKKRQWALETLDIQTRWVLLLDADERVPPKLWEEMEWATSHPDYDGFLVTKGFHFLGQRFRFGGFSHSALVLFRHGRARFERLLDQPPESQDMEVHERLLVEGKVGRLRTPLVHRDFKGLEAYIDRHNRYSTWEALVRVQFLKTGRWGREPIQPRFFGNPQERRRWLKSLAVRAPFEPQLWFLYHYVLRLGFLEGRRGLIASRLRANYIADVRAKMYELALQAKSPSVGAEAAKEPVVSGVD